jgi:hypothetical protein
MEVQIMHHDMEEASQLEISMRRATLLQRAMVCLAEKFLLPSRTNSGRNLELHTALHRIPTRNGKRPGVR